MKNDEWIDANDEWGDSGEFEWFPTPQEKTDGLALAIYLLLKNGIDE